MEPQMIGSLAPGKIYVIRANFRTREESEEFAGHLNHIAPECRFILLGKNVEIIEVIPQTRSAPVCANCNKQVGILIGRFCGKCHDERSIVHGQRKAGP